MSARHFCLKWNNFQTNILNAFESLQNTEDLTDVTLTCEGISLKAHKFILSACSPYFRTVFKENPCSHPIVILKDVLYQDLIAVINFMYHGEVLVSEEQLVTFLQTGKLLQVSGLNESNELANSKKLSQLSPKKIKPTRTGETPVDGSIKKLKVTHKPFPKISKTISTNSDNSQKDITSQSYELAENDSNIKIENDTENCSKCFNENVDVIEKSEQQSSILEAALEVREPKPSSILERSLMSQSGTGKSPSSLPLPPSEPVSLQTIFPETPKTIFIPRKPPETDLDKRPIKSRSSDSSSPSTYDRSTELLQPTIKIEEESYENVEILSPSDDIIQKEPNFQITKNFDIQQPHHSSQCGNCPHCGKVYSNQSALKYHVRLVHSDLTNMYCCHLCPEAFDYREGYKKHMVEVHCIRN